MFRLQDLGDDDAVFEELRQLCNTLRVYPRVVFIDPFRKPTSRKRTNSCLSWLSQSSSTMDYPTGSGRIALRGCSERKSHRFHR
jgi:hypothetical protein